jgi:hypothetical protein
MKLRVITLLCAATLGAAGGAFASSGGTVKAISLTPGMAVGYAGLTCTAYAGSSAATSNLVCVRNNLLGFGVVVSQTQVIIAKTVHGKVKVVFRHANA